MIRFLPFLLKSLWRHRTRTLLTMSGAGVGLFVFCFVGSIQQGMRNLFDQKEAQQTLVVFQANKFCPATSRLPQDYAEKIKQLPGVRDAVPIQVFTNNCRASLKSAVFYGLPPEKVQSTRDFEFIDGSWPEFEENQKSAIIGRAFADRDSEYRVGNSFRLGGYDVNVVGVFESDNAAEETYIYTHLDYLQRGFSKSRVGTVTQIEVHTEPGTDVDALCATIDEELKSGTVPTQTRPKGAFQAKSLGDLTQLLSLSRYLGYACVALVVMLVATTTVMAVQDRLREHAVLKTLGFSSLRVFVLVLIESTLQSATGGAIGVLAALLMLQVLDLSVAADAIAVSFQPSWQLGIVGCGVAAGAGAIAGIFPAFKAAASEIVPALRSE